jgi:hypothetical protein
LIYAQSEPLQEIKGYLSIFRNLTDSQPLADAVLDRLAEQGAAARAAAADLSSVPVPAGAKSISNVP